ncbi:hypothetical protein HPB49_007070 [Dermacentor silvarum]|uniref:Uncharacterized protein n=1 Tax=Dermacentor silvarum TaxID=543639 RepID=A0ACB8D396_DERSI|nr:hypothetical protein HPB49_007070 [Dermacentor silvarum]
MSALGASYEEVRRSPEALAVMSAYVSLNSSLTIVKGDIADVHEKKADITILPISSAVAQKYGLFMYAQHPPASLCVFSLPRRAVQLTFIDSRASVVLFFVSLVLLGCLVAMLSLASYHFGHSARRRRFSAHSLVIYLVSTLLGRCPPTSASLANRSLATAFWALAMLALGNYVQTSITAIRSVPCILGTKSFAELTNDIKSGAMQPCISSEWYEMVTFQRTLHVHLRGLRSITDTLGSHPKGFVLPYSVSLCYEGAQSGTFAAAFSMCTDDEVFTAAQRSLIPGELMVTSLRLASLHPKNPFSNHFGHSAMRRRFNAHSLVIYLVNTLLGRCPSTSASLANRSLATAFWALAMLALGNYVQTSITAIRSVPCILGTKSFAELMNDLKSGTMSTCLSTEWYEVATFRRVLGKGKYVAAFSLCTDDEVFAAAQRSLIPGELTVILLRVVGLHPENPLRGAPVNEANLVPYCSLPRAAAVSCCAAACRATAALPQKAAAVSWHTAAAVYEPVAIVDSATSKAADPRAPATGLAPRL